MTPLSELAYRAQATARVAWFARQQMRTRRLAAPSARETSKARAGDGRPQDRVRLRASFLGAFEQDIVNIRSGLYRAPDPGAGMPDEGVRQAYFADLPILEARRQRKGGTDARAMPESASFPAYYRQNFHWQSDGWFSEASARLYDFQVETVFAGSAAVMRRATALALLAESLKGQDQRRMSVAEVACGTGAFAAEIARNWPRLRLTALDMSPAYSACAGRALAGFPVAQAACAAAEALPFADASVDRLVSVYLFHELPPKVRLQAMAEAARVLRPGGVLVLADSLQTGDDPALDPLLDSFPDDFHEPFYRSWLALDLRAAMARHGFAPVGFRQAFLTKATSWRKPA